MVIKNEFIVLANSAFAKFYHYDTKSHKLVLLKELDNAKSEMKTNEIMADKAGRYQKSLSYNEGTYQPRTDPKDVEAEKFAADVAESLETEANDNNDIVIFAPGHFQALLKNKFKKPLLNKVTAFIDKDYTKLHIKDLEKHLADALDLQF